MSETRRKMSRKAMEKYKSVSLLTHLPTLSAPQLYPAFYPLPHPHVCILPNAYVTGSDLSGNQTHHTQDTSDIGHFGTRLVDRSCPDTLALVPKCPKDSLDISAELSCFMDRTFLPHGPKCLIPGTECLALFLG